MLRWPKLLAISVMGISNQRVNTFTISIILIMIHFILETLRIQMLSYARCESIKIDCMPFWGHVCRFLSIGFSHSQ